MKDNCRRYATVKALTSCRLYSLSINKYKVVLERFPEELLEINRVAKERLKTLNEVKFT